MLSLIIDAHVSFIRGEDAGYHTLTIDLVLLKILNNSLLYPLKTLRQRIQVNLRLLEYW